MSGGWLRRGREGLGWEGEEREEEEGEEEDQKNRRGDQRGKERREDGVFGKNINKRM